MGIGTILIGFALLIIVVTLIVLPLLDARRPAVELPSPREALQAEHAVTVRAIRELDLDYRTHKLAEEDYKRLRADQVQRGAQVLRELDALQPDSAADDIDVDIEAQVAVLRAGNATCPACGATTKAGDRFCARCGAPLLEAPQTIPGQEGVTPAASS